MATYIYVAARIPGAAPPVFFDPFASIMSHINVPESIPNATDDQPEILRLLERMEQRQAEWQSRLLRRIDELESLIRNQDDDKATENPLGMDWEARKREIFAAHGADPSEASASHDDSPAGLAAQQSAVAARLQSAVANSNGQPNDIVSNDGSSPAPNQPAAGDALSNIPPDDREEIERLKSELREKLRQAEMELSISRAKISRENALLEERRAELERLASRVKRQSAAPASEPQRLSMLDRLNRHMQSLKKNEDSDQK